MAKGKKVAPKKIEKKGMTKPPKPPKKTKK